MTTTEQKDWYSGHTIHCGHFHQYAYKVGKLGVIYAPAGKPRFTFYWLI